MRNNKKSVLILINKFSIYLFTLYLRKYYATCYDMLFRDLYNFKAYLSIMMENTMPGTLHFVYNDQSCKPRSRLRF